MPGGYLAMFHRGWWQLAVQMCITGKQLGSWASWSDGIRGGLVSYGATVAGGCYMLLLLLYTTVISDNTLDLIVETVIITAIGP